MDEREVARRLGIAPGATSLLRLVEGAQAGPFVEQVESAPELQEPSGDFF